MIPFSKQVTSPRSRVPVCTSYVDPNVCSLNMNQSPSYFFKSYCTMYIATHGIGAYLFFFLLAAASGSGAALFFVDRVSSVESAS